MFQAIIRVMGDNSLRQFEVLDRVTTNVSNLNTPGYKGQRFEMFLLQDGRIDGTPRTDMTQGQPMITRRELDIAIDGGGYLPVTQPDGTTAYTRDGSLGVNAEGYLVTARGDLVGTGIKLPPNPAKLQILKDGTIQVKPREDQPPQFVGRLTLVNFANPEALKSIGGNKVVPTEGSGPAELAADGSEIKQGMLERANVQMFSQVDTVLRLNASLISGFRLIKFTDDLYRLGVNLKQ